MSAMLDWLGSLGPRREGALVAGAIAVLWTPLAIPGLIRVPSPDVTVFDPIAPAFLTAVPVAIVLAYTLTPKLLALSPRRAVIVTAFLVVIVNVLVVSEVIAVRGLDDTIGVDRVAWLVEALLLGGPVLALMGLLYVGPFALVPASISAAVWLAAMRRSFESRQHPSRPGDVPGESVRMRSS